MLGVAVAVGVSMRPASRRAAQRKAAATSAAAAEEGKLSGKAGNEPALPVGKDVDGIGTGPHTVRAPHPFELLGFHGINHHFSTILPWTNT